LCRVLSTILRNGNKTRRFDRESENETRSVEGRCLGNVSKLLTVDDTRVIIWSEDEQQQNQIADGYDQLGIVYAHTVPPRECNTLLLITSAARHIGYLWMIILQQSTGNGLFNLIFCAQLASRQLTLISAEELVSMSLALSIQSICK